MDLISTVCFGFLLTISLSFFLENASCLHSEHLKVFTNMLTVFIARCYVILGFGPSATVVPAAYWLLQTRPTSGKQEALQQALPNAQSQLPLFRH